jgi:hypothetical protein
MALPPAKKSTLDLEVERKGVAINPKIFGGAKVIDLGGRDLAAQVIEKGGRPKIMPASFYHETTLDERLILCQQNALYCLPTVELIEHLRGVIAGRRAIEIGAGSGAISAALRIRATDNRMQENPEIAAHYRAMGQPVIQYGRQVENLAAYDAVRKYKPEVVVAAWVTHKYREDRHDAGGNMYGVDEEDIIRNCDTYVFVGNQNVHKGKSIWSLPHTIIQPDWLFSRASSGTPDFVAVWQRADIP